MDTSQKPKITDRTTDADADLNLFLYKSGRSFKNLFVRIGRGLENMANALLLSLLFVIKNIWWLLLGAAIGLGYGIYILSSEGPKYSSEMTVKANFGSVRALYTTLDYFNSLIRDRKSTEMSKIFGVSAAEAENLRSFSATPVKTELVTAEMYNNLFRGNSPIPEAIQDTFWLHTIKYEDFKESLTIWDYPVHTVKVVSRSPGVFSAVQAGIVNQVAKNEILRSARQLQTSINSEEEKLLASSISNLDSLRRAYNERLIKGQANTPGSNQLMVVENSPNVKAPELQLYDKLLQLKDELKEVRTRSITEKEIVEVLSPPNPAGKKESFIESIWEYVLAGLLSVLAILILLSIRKSVIAYETRRDKMKAEQNHKPRV